MDLSRLSEANLSFSTKRFSIRLMTASDFDYFAALQADPTLMTYIGEVLETEPLKEKFNGRVNCINDHSQWFTLLIFEKETDKFCGSVGFLLQDIASQRVEIGYVLLSEFHGQGVIVEAAQPMMAFIFNTLKAKKVIAQCAVENIGSWKVMEKLSLQREGCLKSDFCINDIWYDSYYYGLVSQV